MVYIILSRDSSWKFNFIHWRYYYRNIWVMGLKVITLIINCCLM